MQPFSRRWQFTLLLSLLFFAATAVEARGHYWGISAGLMPDLGNLGKTISVDGLDSSLSGRPTMAGAERGKGCYLGSENEVRACRTEYRGLPQKVIHGENELITMERITGGLIQTETSGAMVGLVTNLFYERQGERFFWRVGVAHNKKVRGGKTTSQIAGIEWYNIEWDYEVAYVPILGGIRMQATENSAVYTAIGVNYHQGGWDVGGNNIGDIPTYFLGDALGGIGVQRVWDPIQERYKGNPIINEKGKFRSNGWGFALLLGAEANISENRKLFIEVNHIFASSYGTAIVSPGIAASMTPMPSYPVTLAGTFFSVGLKNRL